ncbi:Protein-tyrosine phosphatase [Dictyocaulus viviparus]|uniref:Protein-tyrosine phosphatase n=1 Tax=Dictyocaulus viviparus TaxID=29172 RepID=A0A0D8XDF8_DICVI|nr:Protein-tyrosine phosphatase [Dictyocaulus viviparus]
MALKGGSRPHKRRHGMSAQAKIHAETIAEFIMNNCNCGQSRMYAEHDMLMKTEKHVTLYNQFPTKNRMWSSVCFDENAVELKTNNKKEEKLDHDNTYINANILESPLGNFVLAQAPMANTLVEWYRMIWQLKISIIVCLLDPMQLPTSERYFQLKEGSHLKIKHRFYIRTISVREDDGLLVNYQLRITNKLSTDKSRTVYVIVRPTKPDCPIEPRKQLNLVAEVWATETASLSMEEDRDTSPILVHGFAGIGRTAAFVATTMLCKSLQLHGVMSPVEVWTRLNDVRHNSARERIHFISSIECALLFAYDIGLLTPNIKQLNEVNKVL